MGLVITNHQDLTCILCLDIFDISGNVNIKKLDCGIDEDHEDMNPPLSTKMV